MVLGRAGKSPRQGAGPGASWLLPQPLPWGTSGDRLGGTHLGFCISSLASCWDSVRAVYIKCLEHWGWGGWGMTQQMLVLSCSHGN